MVVIIEGKPIKEETFDMKTAIEKVDEYIKRRFKNKRSHKKSSH